MTTDLRGRITEWLTGADTCFLLGAGCSVCAQKPTVHELTKKVLEKADENLKKHFSELKMTGQRPATVEDLISYLVRYRTILSTIKNTSNHNISVPEIDNWLKSIKNEIVSACSGNSESTDYHRRFLLRVPRQRQRRPRDLFSLNYDTLLEAALDKSRIPYVDGFRGASRAWFDPETFDEAEAGIGASYRLYKLHGSTNWTLDETGHIRRGGYASENATDEPVIVYPSDEKYQQTQYGVYEILLNRFRNRLRSSRTNNFLIVLGYSFNDEHINDIIFEAIRSNNSNLTVIAFVGPEKEREQQNNRLEGFAKRCDSRFDAFNAFIGSGDTGHFVGNALESDEAKLVLNLELWKFENLVDFIAEDTP